MASWNHYSRFKIKKIEDVCRQGLTSQVTYSRSLWRLLISAPRLSVYYFLSLTVWVSVHPSVCHGQTSNRFFFFVSRWNRAIFGHQFSMWHSTKRSYIFDLGPLTPKIYSPKLLSMMLHYYVATRGRADAHSAVSSAWRKSAIHWTSGTTIVAMAPKFGLVAEI